MTNQKARRRTKKENRTSKRQAIYVSLSDFTHLIKEAERIWGWDSVAYQVLSLEYMLSVENRPSDKEVINTFDKSLRLAEKDGIEEDFLPDYEMMVGRKLRLRRELRETHSKIKKAISKSRHWIAFSEPDFELGKIRRKEITMKAFCYQIMGKRHEEIYKMLIKDYDTRKKTQACKVEARRIKQNILICKKDFFESVAEMKEHYDLTSTKIIHILWASYVPEDWKPDTPEGKKIRQKLLELIKKNRILLNLREKPGRY